MSTDHVTRIFLKINNSEIARDQNEIKYFNTQRYNIYSHTQNIHLQVNRKGEMIPFNQSLLIRSHLY